MIKIIAKQYIILAEFNKAFKKYKMSFKKLEAIWHKFLLIGFIETTRMRNFASHWLLVFKRGHKCHLVY